MLKQLSETELDSMPLDALVERMDDFLLYSYKERYGNNTPTVSLTSEIYNSKFVKSRSKDQIRRTIHLTFSYLVQLELLSVSSGFSNKVLYTPSYKTSDWLSPVFQLRNRSINQFQIISSRVAFEILIDLFHTIEKGERVKSKKSKLKAFRLWLCKADNKFHYFAYALLCAYKFDREVRSPEVHGSSPFTRKLLLLQMPDYKEWNQPLELTNVLINIWRPLIDILNNKRPTYMHLPSEDESWFKVYMSADGDAIEEKLNEMFDSIF